MFKLTINDVVDRLIDLRAYSAELSQRMDHEEGLPEDAIPYLIEKLEFAFKACEEATHSKRSEALDELSGWLIKSYRFYLERLAQMSDSHPWALRFPTSETHHKH